MSSLLPEYQPATQLVEKVARRILKVEGYENPIVQWIRRTPDYFEQDLADVDTLIEIFNAVDAATFSTEFTNLTELKKMLGEKKLPTIKSLLATSLDLLKPFFEAVMHQLKEMILETYTSEDYRTGPTLTFQIDEIPLKSQAIGLIFHAYEEYINGFVDRTVPRGVIRRALTEISSQLPRQKYLWNAVSNPHELNWVENNVDFDTSFRSNRGFH